MEIDQDLYTFADGLRQEIISETDAADVDKLKPEVFTEYMISTLIEAGELEDGTACYHKARGIEVSGYNLDSDGTLSLFTTNYSGNIPPETISRSAVETSFMRLQNFFKKTLEKYYTILEESSEVFDMAQHIYENSQDIVRVRFYLFTDGLTTVNDISNKEPATLPVSYHIWDIRHLYRYMSSGQHKEPIHIDFVEQFNNLLPCLEWNDAKADYAAYLTIIPGDILKSLYELYGTRLLELNVRSFLQAKGKVNQGIRNTILKQPERFLAYNNGISATASNIEVVTLPGGGRGIKSLDDLQIVNGGQTTASIFHTARKDKASLSGLRVQAKISVVAPENIGELVPLISRYANSQNKVAEADFSANDPFHVKIENLSRTIWAPAATGTQRQTRWFYERARGQYQDAVQREGTPARQRLFKEAHPLAQKFSKTDLAKYEMTWDQLPHVVSLGAQKCFIQFTSQLQKRENVEIDQQYFHHLIAKAILFRQAEKIIGSQKFGGYRANIVTYTLAYIYYHTSEQIDLQRIWRQQSIGPNLQEAIAHVAHQVYSVIVSPPGGKNVTEWCKRPECWARVQSLQINIHDLRESELVSINTQKSKNSENSDHRQLITSVPADVWYQLAAWAKETQHLQAWQRQLAVSLGNIKKIGRVPTNQQIIQGMDLLREADNYGFKPKLPTVNK